MTSTHWLIRAQVLLSTMAETVADVDDIIVGAGGFDSGHTAWILMSCALVNFMTPGLAFFYGGLVRRNHVLSIIIQNYVCMGIITLIWVVWGFSLCFGASGWFYGDPGDFVMLNRVSGAPLPSEARGKMGEAYVDGIPGLVFCAYQGMFAVITPALMTGCFESRIRMQSQIYDRGWVSLACFGKLWRAFSRLYQRRFLQPNSYCSALKY